MITKQNEKAVKRALAVLHDATVDEYLGQHVLVHRIGEALFPEAAEERSHVLHVILDVEHP